MGELARPPAPRSPRERLVEVVATVLGADRTVLRSRRFVVATLVVAAALVLGGWSLLRRPPEPTAALPRVADGTSSTVAGPAESAEPAAGSTSGVTDDVPGGGGDAPAGGDGPVVVHVAGAVVRPGVVTLPPGSRAVDAVAAAGGLAPGADPDRVNLAAPVVDGMRLAIPLAGQPAPAELAPQLPGDGGAGEGGAGPGAPVDLNTADAEELDALPGVGPSTAQAIIAHRDEHGAFRSVEDLLDVRGIGEAKLDALRDLVTAGS